MDVHHHRNVASRSPPSPYSAADVVQVVTSLPAQRPQKRSFDVAFLMAPDDLSKRRSRPNAAAVSLVSSAGCTNAARSAFTKVSPDPGPGPLSPGPSPPSSEYSGYHHDGSLSPPPMVPPPPPQLAPPPPLSHGHFMSPFPMGFRTPPAFMMMSPAARPPQQPSGVAVKDVVQYAGGVVVPPPSPLQFGPAAAAALPAMLLPASIAAAALTLPSQNVCAKCNVSFRMTSDLVYHMRSHHKGDGGIGGLGGLGGLGGSGGGSASDAAKKRRDMDKLRCPVCDESFRERHHLTRHMTAHQDKEGDRLDDEDEPQQNVK